MVLLALGEHGPHDHDGPRRNNRPGTAPRRATLRPGQRAVAGSYRYGSKPARLQVVGHRHLFVGAQQIHRYIGHAPAQGRKRTDCHLPRRLIARGPGHRAQRNTPLPAYGRHMHRHGASGHPHAPYSMRARNHDAFPHTTWQSTPHRSQRYFISSAVHSESTRSYSRADSKQAWGRLPRRITEPRSKRR